MEKPLPAREFSPTDLDHWKSTIFDIYNRMRAKAKSSYEVEYGGLTLTVLPNVYAPEFFDDSLWYAKQLQEIVGTKSLLEIGTGTGVIGIFCAKNGARVVVTDINPDAVENARINTKLHGVDISIREGNLYDPIESGEKFDYIFWAHPFNSWDIPVEDMLLRSGIDPGYESLRGYIAGAKDYLAPGGKLLLGTGDSADLKLVSAIAEENSYRMRLIKKADRLLEPGTENKIIDLIYEFVPLS